MANPRSSVPLAIVPALLLALTLGACGSGRERELSEQVMAAKIAAQKADEARIAAERAAAAANRAPVEQVEDVDAEQPDEAEPDVDTEGEFG